MIQYIETKNINENMLTQDIPTYYKPVTFLSFTLNTIKFCPGTFAIPDIFPIFAPTFLTDEIIVKIQW